MKILTAKQVQQADAFTIQNEPIPSIELMERASIKFIEIFEQIVPQEDPVAIVCGTGNNGGDGLAVTRLLRDIGYQCTAFVVSTGKAGSTDFEKNLERLGREQVKFISSQDEIAGFEEFDVIIDAIFGSGLTRPVSGLYAEVIEQINSSGAAIFAIDIPSGLFMDAPAPAAAIIEADFTISFQLPKLAFMFPENFDYVGEWQVCDIGLDQEFIDELETSYQTIDFELAESLLPQRNKFDHKGVLGHGQLIGGSSGKMGAMVLAAEAVLRSGAGLVSVNSPKCGQDILQTAIPEAMIIPQRGRDFVEEFNLIPKITAIGIGPGLGTHMHTITAMGQFLRNKKPPLVIDADGLNILSERAEFIELLPKGTILTPHLKEFDRLAGESENNWQRLEKARRICAEHQIVIVLKGAHTAVVEPNGMISFNTTGNPGMATAGSGDVLLGIITGLLTQGLEPVEAAQLGVFLHGLAGDMAAEELGSRSVIAGDINTFIGEAYLFMEDNLL